MSLPTLPYLEKIAPDIANIFKPFVKRLAQFVSKEHNDDGSHSIITERGRTVPMGEWTTVPYKVTDYTASGAMTWTVPAAPATWKYAQVGKTAFLRFSVGGTTIGGVVNQALQFKLPSTLIPAGRSDGSCEVQDNGVFVAGHWRILPAATNVEVFRADHANWTLSAANAAVLLELFFDTTT